MPSIELTIPTELTTAQIRRANPLITEETAQELAAELHDIIACVQRHYAALPCDRPPPDALEESDAIQTVLRTVVDFWPNDKGATANESIWIMERLTDAGGGKLYLRYLRLCDQINGTNLAGDLNDPPAKKKPSAKKPGPQLVRNDLPPLDAIMQAVTAAVRLAQRGEGPRKILELIPAFKDATGLNFVMQATEAHRGALFDLVQNAGIPVKKGDSK